MSRLIYLDHAATSYPKPPAVTSAVADCMKYRGGNPGRGAHKLSLEAAKEIYACREVAARLFGAEPDRVIFTLNTTHALNLAIKGFMGRRGGHIGIGCVSALGIPVLTGSILILMVHHIGGVCKGRFLSAGSCIVIILGLRLLEYGVRFRNRLCLMFLRDLGLGFCGRLLCILGIFKNIVVMSIHSLILLLFSGWFNHSCQI